MVVRRANFFSFEVEGVSRIKRFSRMLAEAEIRIAFGRQERSFFIGSLLCANPLDCSLLSPDLSIYRRRICGGFGSQNAGKVIMDT